MAGADHQRFVQLGDAVLQEVGGGNRAGALEGVGIEGVEGAHTHETQRAAFRRIGIDPVEMAEAGRVFERTKLRIAVAFADGRPRGKADDQTED
ncbi:hypothetical protein D3C86_1899820 [compost metagenome]